MEKISYEVKREIRELQRLVKAAERRLSKFKTKVVERTYYDWPTKYCKEAGDIRAYFSKKWESEWKKKHK